MKKSSKAFETLQLNSSHTLDDQIELSLEAVLQNTSREEILSVFADTDDHECLVPLQFDRCSATVKTAYDSSAKEFHQVVLELQASNLLTMKAMGQMSSQLSSLHEENIAEVTCQKIIMMSVENCTPPTFH